MNINKEIKETRTRLSKEEERTQIMANRIGLLEAAPGILKALIKMIDRAQLQHPDFKSERGQDDVNNAIKAVEKLGTVWGDVLAEGEIRK